MAKDLKATVEAKLATMLDSETPPSRDEINVVAIAVKYLAVQAKLEESTYGDFFNNEPGLPGDTGSISPEPGPQPASRGRAKRGNGAIPSGPDAP